MLLAVVSLKCRRPRVTLVIFPLGRLTLQNHYLVFHILDKTMDPALLIWVHGLGACPCYGGTSELGEFQNMQPKPTPLKCSMILFGLGTPVLMVHELVPPGPVRVAVDPFSLGPT